VCVCMYLGMSKLLPIQRARRHTIIPVSCCCFAMHVEKPNDERVCVHCCVLLVTISWRSATDTSLSSPISLLLCGVEGESSIAPVHRPGPSPAGEKRPPLAHTRHPSTYTHTLSLANQKFTCSCFRLKRPIIIITIPRLPLLSSSVPLGPSPWLRTERPQGRREEPQDRGRPRVLSVIAADMISGHHPLDDSHRGTSKV
jgi:hypothetical protein